MWVTPVSSLVDPLPARVGPFSGERRYGGDGGVLLLVVVIVITPAGISAYLARRKGLNAWAWFVLGLMLPWAPLFMVVVKRRRKDPRRKVWCENCGAAQRISPVHCSFHCARCAHVNEISDRSLSRSVGEEFS
jgi:hypothetical protein